MGKKKVQPNYRRRTLRLPDLDHSKLAVLNSLGSPVRAAFTSSPSISSLRGTAPNPAWPSTGSWSRAIACISNRVGWRPTPSTSNSQPSVGSRTKPQTGLLSPELAAGISRVRGVKQLGFRTGNWLSADECSAVLQHAYGTTLRAKRDYAMLAMLFGCGLRRSELVGLEMNDIQVRQGHWAVVDLIGKGGHIRTVPIPDWVKATLDEWTAAAGVNEGKIFRAVARTDKIWGDGISQNVVWYVVKGCCEKAGLQHIAPHDLRRTCAKLCHTSGGEIEQIQFLLGHASVQTTERYLGCKQNLGHPVNDLFRLGNVTVATQVSCCPETEVLNGKANCRQLDTMSVNESSGDQEGSDESAGTSFRGNGHASV